jgi:hypothetical protein
MNSNKIKTTKIMKIIWIKVIQDYKINFKLTILKDLIQQKQKYKKKPLILITEQMKYLPKIVKKYRENLLVLIHPKIDLINKEVNKWEIKHIRE